MRRFLRLRGAFAEPTFRKLFGASAFSYGGHQISVLALPALALAVTDATAGEISAMFLWSYLVPLVVSPVAGSLTDRYPAVFMLLLADVLRLSALLFLAVVGLTGRIDIVHIWAVAGILGGGNTAFDVGAQATIPRIVALDRLADANTNMARARALSDTAGPGSAGPLVQWVGPAGALAVDACTYVASMYLVLRLRRLTRASADAGGGPAAQPGATPDRPTWGPSGRLAPAARFLFGQRPLLLLVLGVMLLNSGGAALGAVLVPFAVDYAGVPFAALGIAAGIGNTGLILGAAIAARVIRRFGYLRSSAVSGLATIGSLWAFAAAGFGPAPAVLFGAYHFLFGVTAVTLGVGANTYRQVVTPASMQGSVYGVVRTMVLTTAPVSVAVSSGVTHYVGIEATVLGACVVSSLAAAFLLPLLRHPEPDNAAAPAALGGSPS